MFKLFSAMQFYVIYLFRDFFSCSYFYDTNCKTGYMVSLWHTSCTEAYSRSFFLFSENLKNNGMHMVMQWYLKFESNHRMLLTVLSTTNNGISLLTYAK